MFKYKYLRTKKYKPSALRLSKNFIENVKKESLLRQVIEINGREVIFGVEGPILLQNGKFWYVSVEVKNGKWGKHHIIVSPDLKTLLSKKEAFLRLDSGCLSGMILGDITCDCLDQLRKAQNIVLKNGGIIMHIPNHDGRGWNEYKMANQRIMRETGLDTITVAKKFYGKEDIIDVRTFDESALILKALGFPENYKFELGTKNPIKINALLRAGFNVLTRPIEVKEKLGSLTKNLKAKDKFFQHQKKEKIL